MIKNEDAHNSLSEFASQTDRLSGEMVGLNRLAENFGATMSRSFASSSMHGQKFSDVLKGLALSLSQQALSSALKPLGTMLSSGLGSMTGKLFPNATGNIIANGRISAFADGGIVSSPTLFPMRNGTGLMGEAGPEAILPLARGVDGRLGVRSGGNNNVQVHVTIATPDARSFQQSQSQVAAMMSRAVARGQRNL